MRIIPDARVILGDRSPSGRRMAPIGFLDVSESLLGRAKTLTLEEEFRTRSHRDVKSWGRAPPPKLGNHFALHALELSLHDSMTLERSRPDTSRSELDLVVTRSCLVQQRVPSATPTCTLSRFDSQPSTSMRRVGSLAKARKGTRTRFAAVVLPMQVPRSPPWSPKFSKDSDDNGSIPVPHPTNN